MFRSFEANSGDYLTKTIETRVRSPAAAVEHPKPDSLLVRSARSHRLVAVFMLLLASCTHQPQRLRDYLPLGNAESPVELNTTKFFPQETYQCGPAALATVLVTAGVSVTPRDLTDKVFLPERQGSLQLELIAASRRYGRLPYVLDQEFAALLAEVMAGRPVLVLQNLGLASYPIWHYAVVIGFDPAREALILRSGDRQRLALGTRKFLRSWALADNWAMVVLRPGEFPVGVDETRYLRAIAALEATDQVDTALAFYAPVLSRWPDNTVALFGIGNIHFMRGDLLQAEASYRHLLSVQPNHAAARNNLAQLLTDGGCHNEALAEINVALAGIPILNPLHEHLVNTRSDILKNRQQRSFPTRNCGIQE